MKYIFLLFQSAIVIIFFCLKSLYASDFEYIGPYHNYVYSYCYPDKEHAFNVTGNFNLDHYINKKKKYGGEISYILYEKNKSIMIKGNFEEYLISSNKTWIQHSYSYSNNNERSMSKFICNKYYKTIDNNNHILVIIREGKNIILEEVYLKNIGLILDGGYSKDIGRDIDEYAFISIVDGESINGTYIEDIKKDIFDVLKEYDIDRSTQQNIPN